MHSVGHVYLKNLQKSGDSRESRVTFDVQIEFNIETYGMMEYSSYDVSFSFKASLSEEEFMFAKQLLDFQNSNYSDIWKCEPWPYLRNKSLFEGRRKCRLEWETELRDSFYEYIYKNMGREQIERGTRPDNFRPATPRPANLRPVNLRPANLIYTEYDKKVAGGIYKF